MKFGYSLCFRPFGEHQKAWFYKHYVFNSNEERMNFVCAIPKWKRRWPFECGFYVIPEEKEGE